MSKCPNAGSLVQLWEACYTVTVLYSCFSQLLAEGCKAQERSFTASTLCINLLCLQVCCGWHRMSAFTATLLCCPCVSALLYAVGRCFTSVRQVVCCSQGKPQRARWLSRTRCSQGEGAASSTCPQSTLLWPFPPLPATMHPKEVSTTSPGDHTVQKESM